MNDALATAKQPEPQALEQIKNTQMSLTTTILDRENLKFFADMIEHANLIPMEKGGADTGYAVLPMAVRKSRVMAKICAGVAHNFDPISSQQNLDIIDGKIGLNARGCEVKLARTDRYTTRIEYLDDTGCKLSILEKADNGKWLKIGEVEFTRKMADAAGLTGKKGDMYAKYGQDMFYARCITRVCKRYAPETLDTAGVAYNLAKQAAAEVDTTPTATTAPQIEQGDAPDPVASEPVGEEYTDHEYTSVAEPEAEIKETTEASEAEDPAIEGEPVDPSEAKRADLIIGIDEMIAQKVGGMPSDRKSILKGRDLNVEPIQVLQSIYDDLNAM